MKRNTIILFTDNEEEIKGCMESLFPVPEFSLNGLRQFASGLGFMIDTNKQHLGMLNGLISMANAETRNDSNPVIRKYGSRTVIEDNRINIENIRIMADKLSSKLQCKVLYSSVFEFDCCILGEYNSGEEELYLASGAYEEYGIQESDVNIFDWALQNYNVEVKNEGSIFDNIDMLIQKMC